MSDHATQQKGFDPLVVLQNKLGYQFNNIELLKQALTHKSASKKHNERLEFLGDAVLGLVVAEHLYHTYPDMPEGKLTRMRSSLVKGVTLAQIAADNALGQYLKLGPGELKSGGQRRESILEDAVEAIIGAIYEDADFVTCQSFILSLLADKIGQLDPNAHPKDAKTRLQEYLQGRKYALPTYEVVNIRGQDHDQTFTVHCHSELCSEPVIGEGNSRRKAEQVAAKHMLEKITDA
ncbi:MAG: ribonuclease III [Glaciecola sp.]|jgi:ribonuclease-3